MTRLDHGLHRVSTPLHAGDPSVASTSPGADLNHQVADPQVADPYTADPEMPDPYTADPQMAAVQLLTLCTGNAARSVIAGALLAESVPDADVVTAGTHVVEYQPMSIRTRRAFEHLGMPVPQHRSHQLTEADLATADLVVAMAAEHVHYVRRRHPEAAGRTATVCWLARHLPPGPGALAARVAGMDLAAVDPEEQGDVDDPAGGEDAAYLTCAEVLQQVVVELALRL